MTKSFKGDFVKSKTSKLVQPRQSAPGAFTEREEASFDWKLSKKSGGRKPPKRK